MDSSKYVRFVKEGGEVCYAPYSKFVSTRLKCLGSPLMDVLHAVVGISGEAGELLDAVKKSWIYCKPLDFDNVIEELGDLQFYITALQSHLGITDEQITKANVAKLCKRYAEGYTDKAAQARADKTDGDVV